jgi:hypothetical protein
MDKEELKEKASEQVTLSRGTMWMLRIAAFTGIIGALSHLVDFLHQLGVL